MTLSAFANGEIFGERIGDGEVQIVAMHGWRKNHTDLEKVLQGYTAISLDLPGHGATPEPNEAWGAREYATAVAKVIDELGHPVILFGHSFGGRIAVCLAAERPDLVRSMVITGAPLIRRANQNKPPLKYKLVRWANKIGLISNERMERERQKRGSVDYKAAHGIMRDVFVKCVNESYDDELRRIKCPVEFVWGELDTAAPLGQGQEGAELVEQHTLTVIPGGSHWLVNDNPEPLREAMDRCLS